MLGAPGPLDACAFEELFQGLPLTSPLQGRGVDDVEAVPRGDRVGGSFDVLVGRACLEVQHTEGELLAVYVVMSLVKLPTLGLVRRALVDVNDWVVVDQSDHFLDLQRRHGETL